MYVCISAWIDPHFESFNCQITIALDAAEENYIFYKYILQLFGFLLHQSYEYQSKISDLGFEPYRWFLWQQHSLLGHN